MTDLSLRWNSLSQSADIALDAGQLLLDDGLQTAILISLFTDARAAADDRLPEANADRRGWWGDLLSPVAGWEMGSKLWLLSREKQLSPVLARARTFAQEALAWMIEDEVASRIDVEASFPRNGWLGLIVTVHRPNGPSRERYDFAWNATDNQLRSI